MVPFKDLSERSVSLRSLKKKMKKKTTKRCICSTLDTCFRKDKEQKVQQTQKRKEIITNIRSCTTNHYHHSFL